MDNHSSNRPMEERGRVLCRTCVLPQDLLERVCPAAHRQEETLCTPCMTAHGDSKGGVLLTHRPGADMVYVSIVRINLAYWHQGGSRRLSVLRCVWHRLRSSITLRLKYRFEPRSRLSQPGRKL